MNRASVVLDDVTSSAAIERLRVALSGQAVPAAQRAYAEGLADRLQNGVRVVFMGPRGVGKSALCDALLGTSGAKAPADQSRHFYVDGAIADPHDLGTHVQSFVIGRCALGHVQILDLSGANDPSGAGTIERVLNYADIVLWCTQVFTPGEAALWSLACDELKDRSFLVLTKADVLAREGQLNTRIEKLQVVVEEEFHSLLPTTATQILERTAAGQTVSDAQLAASGVKALIDAVHSIVLSGQRADLDSALLFLERHGLPKDALPQPAEPRLEPADADQSQATFDAAIEMVTTRAYDLAELGFDASDGDMSDVLDLCVVISQELVDNVLEQRQDNPELSPWCDAFQDASDKVMLMGLENDTRSAADAVTILLQLRRDLESLQVS